MNVLAKITNLGISESLDQDTVKRIRIVNQISLFIFLLSLLLAIISFLFEYPGIVSLLFLSVSVLSLLPPLLNKAEKTVASRVILLCFSYGILFGQAIIFGAELHFQFFLVIAVGVPFLLFDQHIRTLKWLLVLTPIVLWLYLEWHFINNSPLIPIDPNSLYWPRVVNNLILFAVILVMFYVFTRQSNEHIKNIEKQRLAIETLLREVHHRVKNNLQVITSLLGLQSMGIKEQKIKNLFQDLQHRINSMALSHEMLYQTNDLTQIDYEAYIEKLISGLITSMKGTENTIDIQLNMEKVYLNIDTAIPLGLIINEVITNSLKYAFKNGGGTITICLKKLNYPNFLLEIGDDGVGYLDTELKSSRTSLGLTLIQKLTDQLKGNILRDSSKHGTNYIIQFQEITANS